jgi:hypothetical protein
MFVADAIEGSILPRSAKRPQDFVEDPTHQHPVRRGISRGAALLSQREGETSRALQRR